MTHCRKIISKDNVTGLGDQTSCNLAFCARAKPLRPLPGVQESIWGRMAKSSYYRMIALFFGFFRHAIVCFQPAKASPNSLSTIASDYDHYHAPAGAWYYPWYYPWYFPKMMLWLAFELIVPTQKLAKVSEYLRTNPHGLWWG